MLSHDRGIVTLIYICNCETYVALRKQSQNLSKAFKLI